MRQVIRRIVELGIGQRPTVIGQRYRIPGTRHLRRKHRRDRHRRACRFEQRRTIAPLIDERAFTGVVGIDRRQRPSWIGSHRHQHLLQPGNHIGGVDIRKQLPATQCAEEEVVTDPREDQPESTDETGIGHRRGCGDPAEVQREGVGEEVNNHPVGRLTGIAELGLALKGVHRESLMGQRFPDSRVDMGTEVGDG